MEVQVKEQITNGVSPAKAHIETGKKCINLVFPRWCSQSLNMVRNSSIDATMKSLGIVEEYKFLL